MLFCSPFSGDQNKVNILIVYTQSYSIFYYSNGIELKKK